MSESPEVPKGGRLRREYPNGSVDEIDEYGFSHYAPDGTLMSRLGAAPVEQDSPGG